MILDNPALEAYLEANPKLTYNEFHTKIRDKKQYLSLTQFERWHNQDILGALFTREDIFNKYQGKSHEELLKLLILAVVQLQRKVDDL